MELDGLKRCLADLRGSGVPLTSLTTDRHIGVEAHMRKEEQGIKHYFDTWHVVKGKLFKFVY